MTLGAVAKRIAKRVVSPLVEWSGLADRKIEQLIDAENRLLIVMYHRVIDDPAEDPFDLGMCVTRATFEAQIAWFRRHFQLIGLPDALARTDRGEPLPRRSLAITFDDGYRDNLLVAAPILARHRAPAAFYVVTGGLDEGRPLWWDQVIAIVSLARETQIDTESLGLAGVPPRLSLSSLRRTGSLQALLTAMWALPPPVIDAMIERLRTLLRPVDDPRLAAPRMTPLEVMKLAASGFTIGAHTVRHADPAALTPDEIRDELRHSRQALESIAQTAVTSFAYPDGRMSAGMPALVREAGFDHAVATVRGINRLPFDRFALSRIGMPEAPIADFKRAIRNVGLVSGQ